MLIWSVCRQVKTESAPFAATLEELHQDLVLLGQLRESFVEGVRDQGSAAKTSAETSTRTPIDRQRRGTMNERRNLDASSVQKDG
jgi:hypothetical protein